MNKAIQETVSQNLALTKFASKNVHKKVIECDKNSLQYILLANSFEEKIKKSLFR